MHLKLTGLAAVALAFAVAACDRTGQGISTNSTLSLGTAFSSVPAGFSNTDNTFPATADMQGGWIPDGHESHEMGMGMRGIGFNGAMLGGGMHDGFLGRGFGIGFGHGFFGLGNLSSCTYSSSTGTFTCTSNARNGLTVTRTIKLQNASGQTQSAYDTATTNTVTEQVTVTGTFTRRDSATTTVQHGSTRTVSGLASGSTQRTINGSSAGTETTTGKDTAGTYTVTRVAGDTTRNVVIPVPTAASMTFPYPTAGTIIRAMQVTLTRTGQTPSSATRREVITYNGTTTATLVITENGTTKTCSLPLPFGRPSCQ